MLELIIAFSRVSQLTFALHDDHDIVLLCSNLILYCGIGNWKRSGPLFLENN